MAPFAGDAVQLSKMVHEAPVPKQVLGWIKQISDGAALASEAVGRARSIIAIFTAALAEAE